MQLRSEKPERNRIRLTMAVGVAALLGEVLLPFEHHGWGNHLLVAAGVLLEQGSHASFPGHQRPPLTGGNMKSFPPEECETALRHLAVMDLSRRSGRFDGGERLQNAIGMLSPSGYHPGVPRLQPHSLSLDLQFCPACNHEPNHLILVPVLGFVPRRLLV